MSLDYPAADLTLNQPSNYSINTNNDKKRAFLFFKLTGINIIELKAAQSLDFVSRIGAHWGYMS